MYYFRTIYTFMPFFASALISYFHRSQLVPLVIHIHEWVFGIKRISNVAKINFNSIRQILQFLNPTKKFCLKIIRRAAHVFIQLRKLVQHTWYFITTWLLNVESEHGNFYTSLNLLLCIYWTLVQFKYSKDIPCHTTTILIYK